MNNKRIITIQDISCVGQCSLTVALPIISACGVETCILPSAVLSNHTAKGFSGFTFKDLTDEMPAIIERWKIENVSFDALYTGYLGSVEQIGYVKEVCRTLLNDGAEFILDPVMADNGKLYSNFNMEYVEQMRSLLVFSDIVLPNITEACLLTDTEYKEKYDEEYVDELLKKLTAAGAKEVVLTGVGYDEVSTGVVVYKDGKKQYYKHKKIPKSYHGTGDIYASSFTGALMNGKTPFEAAKIAADYTVMCIESTYSDPSHWYGVKFERELGRLIDLIAK